MGNFKILVSKKTGNYYYYKNNGDFHSKEGYIKEEDLKSNKTHLKTNIGREFLIFNNTFYDEFKILKRGPQLITPKDLGYIVARSGINKNSIIIEAGSGTGAATCFFAGICKKVKSFEIKEEHLKIAKFNAEKLNLKNITFKLADLADIIEKEKPNSIDTLFLDMPTPEKILEKNLSCLKNGSFIVCYVPSIFQIQKITKTISENPNLYLEEISEIILREWKVWDKIARPNHRKEIDHTAFLVFIRKI